MYLCIQGGRPSPFDRNMGSRMAIKCAEKLLEQIQASKKPDGLLHVDSAFHYLLLCIYWEGCETVDVYCADCSVVMLNCVCRANILKQSRHSNTARAYKTEKCFHSHSRTSSSYWLCVSLFQMLPALCNTYADAFWNFCHLLWSEPNRQMLT